MTNLARTQGDWNALLRESGLFLGPLKQLKDVGRKYQPRRARTQAVEQSSVNGFTSAWTLTGVIFGTNTDESGLLYVRIANNTPGAGQAQVSLYRAVGAGGSDLMAQGSATYPGTVTLAAQNASGLSGTVVITTVTTNETDDKHRLLMFPDWVVRARAVFNGTQPEHGALIAAYLDACAQTLSAMSAAAGAWNSALNTYLQTRLRTFQKSSQGVTINKNTIVDSSFNVTTDYTGLLEDTRKNMVDELTAGAQTILGNTVMASAAFDSQNQGQGAMVTPTMEQWAQNGLITLVCNDSTIGSEKFTVTQFQSDTGVTVQAANTLQVKRAFADPTLGIKSMVLTRSLTVTGGSTQFATAADWVSIAGETSLNTSSGGISVKVVDGGSGLFIIQGFKDNSYVATSQVFATAAGAANAVVVISPTNGSGFSGSGKIGSAPTIGNTGNINLNTFQTKNTNSVPDKITVNVTVTAAGEFQQLLSDLFGYGLNSVTSSPTLIDNYVSAGTFPPYTVRDA